MAGHNLAARVAGSASFRTRSINPFTTFHIMNLLEHPERPGGQRRTGRGLDRAETSVLRVERDQRLHRHMRDEEIRIAGEREHGRRRFGMTETAQGPKPPSGVRADRHRSIRQ